LSSRARSGRGTSGAAHVKPAHLREAARAESSKIAASIWIPSAVGLVVSAYLWGLDLFAAPAFCLTRYGCDLVRQSAYGKILGIPVAAYGVVFFAAALGLALTKGAWRERWLIALAGAGAGVSLVLIVVQLAVVRAVCPYCLVAEAAAFALAYAVLRGRPRTAVTGAGLAGLVVVAAMTAVYAWGMAPTRGENSGPSAYAAGLARHLSQTGVVFYGAYWCPHCRDQKLMFGSAASALPYVECDPKGANAQAARCIERGVKVYPTWDFHGQIVEGVLPLDELARRSGYPPP